jgi:hypothetical protein
MPQSQKRGLLADISQVRNGDGFEANTATPPQHGTQVLPVLQLTRLSSLRVCKQRRLRLASHW